MGYIPKHALRNLEKYKYQGVDKSILSKYVLNPYWNQLVKLWPRSVAPNTITLTGLSLVFLNFLTLLYYDPGYLTTKEGVSMPNWIYFTWAAGLFLYQSLDAIDGKQARRTQMAGPLGEMFDHGCDALNTTLEAILACYALNLGHSWWTVASEAFACSTFYLTTWEEYHTGQLFLGVFSGPVEGILMIVGLYVITGFTGPAFWDTPILTFFRLHSLASSFPSLNLPLNIVFMIFSGIGLLFNILTSISNVRTHMRPAYLPTPLHTPTPSAGSSSTDPSSTPPSPLLPPSFPIVEIKGKIQHFKPLLRITPLPLSLLIHFSVLSAPTPSSSTILHSPLFLPFLLSFGLQFAHQVGRMILAHLTQRRDMPFVEVMWVPTILAGLDLNSPYIFNRGPLLLTTHSRLALFIQTSLLLSLLTYARFVFLVITDITNHLGIACFTVRKKGRDGVWRSAVPSASGGSERVVAMGEKKDA